MVGITENKQNLWSMVGITENKQNLPIFIAILHIIAANATRKEKW